MTRVVPVMSFLAVGLVVSACGGRPYWVRPSHLERARVEARRTGAEVAIPALDRRNEPTYLNVDTIQRIQPVDSTSGLRSVVASDPRSGYRIAGIVMGAVGALFIAAPKEGSGEVEVVAGAGLLGAGATLFVLSLVLEGAEADAPTPGFPATVQEP